MGNKHANQIKMGPRLGGGSFGEVYEGTWNGNKVALKKLPNFFFENGSCNSGRVFDRCKREWEILSKLDHPNIVQYYTVILSKTVPPIIVLELCDYDLDHFISELCQRKVPFQDTVSIMSDVAQGLDYLHNFEPEPIIHRDLASKNVLIKITRNQKQAKITDMGLSRAFPQRAMYATAAVGTPIYAAPETLPTRTTGRLSQVAYYTEKADIFSFGALLLEVIIGRKPINPLPPPLLEGGEVLEEHIRRSEDIYIMGPDHPLHSLVMGCFENEPEQRPNARELIEFLEVFKTEDNQTDSKSMHSSRVSLARSVAGSSMLDGGFDKLKVGSPSSHASVLKLTPNRYDYSFKVSVLGDPGVGKTSIIHRFLHPEMAMYTRKTTIEPGDFFERLQYLGKSVHIHIVDTPGEKRLMHHFVSSAGSVVPMIYRGVDGAAIVFDVGDRYSFKSAREWIRAVRDRCGEDTPIILVGNKTDLEQTSWKVSSVEAEALVEQCDLVFYIETSAVGLLNIDEIFCVLIQKMIERKNQETLLMEKSPDWIFYQSPKHSLLKSDNHSAFTASQITDRQTDQPLPSANILLEPENPSINDRTNHGGNPNINNNTNHGQKRKRWWWC